MIAETWYKTTASMTSTYEVEHVRVTYSDGDRVWVRTDEGHPLSGEWIQTEVWPITSEDVCFHETREHACERLLGNAKRLNAILGKALTDLRGKAQGLL